MSPAELASWVEKIFKRKSAEIVGKNTDFWKSFVAPGAKKEVDTSNILKLQVNGFTMTVSLFCLSD